MILLQKIKRKFFKPKELLKVYSHPRSGTHFLEAFLAENFYKNKDLNIPNVIWGHWSNRKENTKGNPYGKLFGNHHFADKNNNTKPKLYIYRDGRAVAYSVWKTNNFIHKDLEGISFSEFLKTKIDWHGTPAVKTQPKYTIIEHWQLHVHSWLDLAKTDENLLILKYEDLIDDPYKQYEKIHSKFFRRKRKLTKEKIDIIKKPLGLLPNKGTKDAWENIFTEKDLNLYDSLISNKLIK